MKKQLQLSFLLIIAIFGIGTGAVIQNLLRSTTHLQDLINLHEIEDIRQELNLRVQKVQAYVILPGIDFSYNLDEVIKNVRLVEVAAENCHNCHHEPAVQEDLDYARHLITDFEEKLSYLITTVEDTQWRRDNQEQAIKLSKSIIVHIQDMVSQAAATLQKKTDEAMTDINRSYSFLITTLLITFATTMIIAPYLIKKITAPIKKLHTASKKIAAGELGYTTDLDTSPEFAELFSSFNKMSTALAEKEAENKKLYADLETQLATIKQTQHQLVTAGKLASLGKLAGGIAHDFNNILCGIIGHVNILKMSRPEGSHDSKILTTIYDASYHASKLVEQLMTFAKQQDWQEVPVDLNQIVLEAGQELTEQKADTVIFTTNLADNLNRVKGDPDRLREMITNIWLNSLQAVGKDGIIEVSSKLTETAQIQTGQSLTLPHGQYVNIKISDNGKGIPKDVLPMVFDPYFSTQELGNQKGVGLGMAIAFSIVRKHEGYLHIDSTESSGTTVNIFLPALTA